MKTQNSINNKYGINMKNYCREHEAAVRKALEESKVTEELLEHHLEMIKRIQHERLIHLIVTVMVVLAELFVVDIALLHPEFGAIPAAIMLALAVLLGFYFYHYFFLENTVQRWYIIADRIREKLGS